MLAREFLKSTVLITLLFFFSFFFFFLFLLLGPNRVGRYFVASLDAAEVVLVQPTPPTKLHPLLRLLLPLGFSRRRRRSLSAQRRATGCYLTWLHHYEAAADWSDLGSARSRCLTLTLGVSVSV